MSNFKIEGAKELNKALGSFTKDIEQKIAKQAVRAGANVIAKEARLLAPMGVTGTLKRSIKVVARSKRTGDAVASVVTRSGKKYTFRNMNAWYAGMVEFGTSKNPARPFLRPALDSKGPEAIKAISNKIVARIKKMAVLKK